MLNITAFTGNIVRPVFFIEMEFDDGFFRACTADRTITADGKEFYGLITVGAISEYNVQTGTVAPSMKFTLTAIPANMTDYVANQNTRNKAVKVYVMLFNEFNEPLTDLILWFGGTIDSLAMEIGQIITVSASASSRLINWAKSVNTRYTNEDQQNKYPDDDGFKFMSALANLQLTWGG
ncbi:tail protein [Acinetobacter phage Loki]|uniref:Uncharacterized protein n=1 Tax=Acinetobacter phage Loki TaxID=1970374 RepID=A0A0N7MKP8_9CAUD|nr:tail protein [Acinetobacter phage Loki]CUS06479.1 hypothetical protein [Acinetobacter phage Loki]